MGSEGSAIRSRTPSRSRSRTPSISLQVDDGGDDGGGGGGRRRHSFTGTSPNRAPAPPSSGRLSPNLSPPTWDYDPGPHLSTGNNYSNGGGGGGGGHQRRHSSGRFSPSLPHISLSRRSSNQNLDVDTSSSGRTSRWKGKGKHRAPRLPPRVINHIVAICLARAFEMGDVPYRTAASVLKSVNREIRNITLRQQMATVCISTSLDLQKYEALMHDDFPPPFVDEEFTPPSSPLSPNPSHRPTPRTYNTPPLHPRDLTKYLVLQIGGQRYNYYKERSILNFVSLGDCERLLRDPVLSVNLVGVSLEFRPRHPPGLVSDILGGMSEERRKGLQWVTIKCAEMDGCRNHEEEKGKVGGGGDSDSSSSEGGKHHHSYLQPPPQDQKLPPSPPQQQRRRPTRQNALQIPSSPTKASASSPVSPTLPNPSYSLPPPPPNEPLFPSLTSLSLSCTSHSLVTTLLSHTPSLLHLRLGGSFSVLPSLPQSSPHLLSLTLELKNGRRDYDAWCVPRALDAGLLAPLPPVRRKNWKREYTSKKGKDEDDEVIGEEVQRTLYLEGVNELTLRWRGDLQAVNDACQKWRVRLIQPPPPPYTAGGV